MSTSGSILPVTGAGAGCFTGRWRPPLSPRMMNTDDDCTILFGGREGRQWLQPMMSFQPETWRLVDVAVSVPVSIIGKCLFTAWIFNLFLNLITVIISWEQTEDKLSLLPASTKSGSWQGCRMSELLLCITPEHIWWVAAQKHMGSPKCIASCTWCAWLQCGQERGVAVLVAWHFGSASLSCGQL